MNRPLLAAVAALSLTACSSDPPPPAPAQAKPAPKGGFFVAPPATVPTGYNVEPTINPSNGGQNVNVVGGSVSLGDAGSTVALALGVSYDLGGYTSDAGADAGPTQITGSSTPLLVGCDVCVDDGASTTIYCAADPLVNGTAGSAHKGIPLSATGQSCRLIPVKDASLVYCTTAAGSPVAYITHCY